MLKFLSRKLFRVYSTQEPTVIHNFKITETASFPQYNLKLIQLTHETGAKYYHVETKDKNNVFGIGFKTPPSNDKGVPHILEHCVLCGSEKYPVNDPFMKMQNRSLNSYMNAMTADDWTFYPFRTRNKSDFYNLMGIYVDAVFFPCLDKADFYREGWNVQKPEKSSASIGGVVFNEMKGAYNDPIRQLHHSLVKSLMPKTIYAHESGGIPLSIPTLSYDELKEFHKQYYRPENTLFYSYGDFALNETAEFIDKHALGRFKNKTKGHPVQISAESLRQRCDKVDVKIPKEPVVMDKLRMDKVAVGWLCGDKNDHQLNFDMSFLSALLLSGKHTVLYNELVQSGVGCDFLPFTGFSSDTRQSYFCVGLNGVTNETKKDFLRIVNEALIKAKSEQFSENKIASKLHQIELWDKYVSSNFGLNLGIAFQSKFVHGIDPKNIFSVNERIASLKDSLAKTPGYFADLIDRYLIRNQHMSIVVSEVSDTFDKETDDLEKKMTEKFTDSDIEKIRCEVEKPKKEDIGVLPTLSLDSDVSPEIERVDIKVTEFKGKGHVVKKIYESVQATNGLTLISLAFEITKIIPENLRPYLPLYTECLRDFSVKGTKSKDLDMVIDTFTGGLSCSIALKMDPEDAKKHKEYISLESFCLERNVEKMIEIFEKLILTPVFEDDDIKKIIESIDQKLSESNSDLANNGLSFASSLASYPKNSFHKSKETYFGLSQIRFLTELHRDQLSPEKLRQIFSRISTAIKTFGVDKIFVSGSQHSVDKTKNLILSDKKDFSEIKTNPPPNSNANEHVPTLFPKQLEKAGKLFISLPIQCNHVALSIPTVPYAHPDHAALMVLAKVLQWEFLHKAIREEGNAYGSGAGQSNGVFSMHSYRDPNDRKTLLNFARAVDWALAGKLGAESVKSAILSAFSDLEKPVSPNRKGLRLFYGGVTDDLLLLTRRRLLAVTKEDVARVAEKYLAPHSEWLAGRMADEEYARRVAAESERAHVAIAGMQKLLPTLTQSGWRVQS